MDFSVYDNSKELQKKEEELKSIDPVLQISGIQSYDGTALRVSTCIRMGGNRDTIAKLIEKGWTKVRGFRGKGYAMNVMETSL